jgi:hypothetical protein
MADDLRLRPAARPGTVTAALAISGLLLGGVTGYSLTHGDSAPRIILRQANSDLPTQPSTLGKISADAGLQIIVPITNDSSVAVEVFGATLEGQDAAAAEATLQTKLQPGASGYTDVLLPDPNRCGNVAMDSSAPAQITVYARVPGGSEQPVPVQITGTMGAYLDGCAL